MARLATERAELLWQILSADERALSESLIFQQPAWTVKDILAHIAAWDRWEHRTMISMLIGDQLNLTAVQDMDAFNATVLAEWRERSLAEVVVELEDARTTWLAWLRQVSSDVFFCPRWFADWNWTFPNCLKVQWEHDAEHAKQIARWREEMALEDTSSGPKAALLAALNAARKELLAAADLVSPGDRTTRRVCGAWTLKDVVGHIADWEQVGVEGLREMAAGSIPSSQHIADIEFWNQAHAEARRDDPWEVAWTDLQGVRRSLVTILEDMSDEELAVCYSFPWGPQGTTFQWIRVFISHDREHADDLRAATGCHPERDHPA
jgi:uncharacterized damage-inducible protein DinB